MPANSETTESETWGGATEGSPRPAGVRQLPEVPVFVVDDHHIVLDAIASTLFNAARHG